MPIDLSFSRLVTDGDSGSRFAEVEIPITVGNDDVTLAVVRLLQSRD